MSVFKKAKDQFLKFFWGKKIVPRGLFELQHYFRTFGPIHFEVKNGEDGGIIAVSQDFKFGSIVTKAATEEDLQKNIQDAVLTAFEVPSSYAKEADTKVQKVGGQKEMYAAA